MYDYCYDERTGEYLVFHWEFGCWYLVWSTMFEDYAINYCNRMNGGAWQ